jgi:hypothetical protein
MDDEHRRLIKAVAEARKTKRSLHESRRVLDREYMAAAEREESAQNALSEFTNDQIEAAMSGGLMGSTHNADERKSR